MEQFTGISPHKPLVGDDIRLVSLHPGTWDAPLRLTISHEPLLSPHLRPYTALSYCWGDPKITKPISLDGIAYPATVNLESALRHLRDAQAEKLMWIDALCVNQTDMHERSVQVPRMRDIYRNAAETRIWLGDYGDRSPASMKALFDVIRSSSAAEQQQPGPGLDGFANTPHFEELLSLLARPWFSRIWVVQEAAISRALSRATFQCGSEVVPFEDFNNFPVSLRPVLDASISKLSLRDRNRTSLTLICTTYQAIKREYEEGGRHFAVATWEFQLLQYIMAASIMQATNIKDKIYGLLGLVVGELSLPPQLMPDYALSDREVFIQYGSHLLSTTKCVSLMELRGPGSPADFPSWVPMWTSAAAKLWRPELEVGKRAHVKLLDGNRVEVEGIELFEVRTKPVQWVVSPESTVAEMKRQLQELEDNMRPGGTDKWWVELLTDAGYNEDELNWRFNPILMYRHLLGQPLPPYTDPTLVSSSDFIDEFHRWLGFVQGNWPKGSWLAWDDHHGALALINASMPPRKGDKVFALKGGRSWFCLRPRGSEWAVVTWGGATYMREWVHCAGDADITYPSRYYQWWERMEVTTGIQKLVIG